MNGEYITPRNAIILFVLKFFVWFKRKTGKIIEKKIFPCVFYKIHHVLNNHYDILTQNKTKTIKKGYTDIILKIKKTKK